MANFCLCSVVVFIFKQYGCSEWPDGVGGQTKENSARALANSFVLCLDIGWDRHFGWDQYQLGRQFVGNASGLARTDDVSVCVGGLAGGLAVFVDPGFLEPIFANQQGGWWRAISALFSGS